MKIGALLSAVFLFCAGIPAAWADGSGGIDRGIPDSPARRTAPAADDYTEAERAVKTREYEKAIAPLQRILSRQPGNVDALNYLAYSHRELGRYDVSLGYYRQALAIDPNHRGANEYLGELYLRLGKMKEARAQLVKLQTICGRGCEEYEALRAAIGKAGGRS